LSLCNGGPEAPSKQMMTPSAFKRSLLDAESPRDLLSALRALWWAGNDNWDKAHKIAMYSDNTDSAWVHAYLNRVEGDLENARYWYRQARRKPPTGNPSEEWSAIAEILLAD
jgi:hypothetical protein